VLLDLRLKDGESFSLIETLNRQFPGLPILMLSQTDELAVAERVLRAGARGYVMKHEAPNEVLGAIRTALVGNLYLSRDLAGRLLQKFLGNRALLNHAPTGRAATQLPTPPPGS
jgi:DNA-binding NarL/FixJ family response regulator